MSFYNLEDKTFHPNAKHRLLCSQSQSGYYSIFIIYFDDQFYRKNFELSSRILIPGDGFKFKVDYFSISTEKNNYKIMSSFGKIIHIRYVNLMGKVEKKWKKWLFRLIRCMTYSFKYFRLTRCFLISLLEWKGDKKSCALLISLLNIDEVKFHHEDQVKLQYAISFQYQCKRFTLMMILTRTSTWEVFVPIAIDTSAPMKTSPSLQLTLNLIKWHLLLTKISSVGGGNDHNLKKVFLDKDSEEDITPMFILSTWIRKVTRLGRLDRLNVNVI